VLTESDLDENVMSNDNCHGFAGLGSGTGERRHSRQPYFFGANFSSRSIGKDPEH